MSKTKKILSILLVAAMVLGIAPVSALNTVASAYTYSAPAAVLTDGRFSVSASASEVVRVAYALGAFTYAAEGSNGVIVQATPSGIPYTGSGFATEAYMGETPVSPKVTFSITNATPTTTPTVVATGGSNITLSAPATSTSGTTTTYIWTLPTDGVAAATAGNDITYTISYTINGVTYVSYAASHVENILSPSGIAVYHFRDRGTAGANTRSASLTRLMGKNTYSSMGSGTSNGDKTGFISFAADKSYFTGEGTTAAVGGFGSEDYLSMDANAILVDRDNAYFNGTKPYALFKSSKSGDNTTRYNCSVADDGNRPHSTVYLDKGNSSESTMAAINFRFGIMKTHTGNNSYIKTNGLYFMNGAYAFSSDTGSFTSSTSTSLLTYQNNIGNQVSDLWGMNITQITGAGFNLTTTAQSADYTIVGDIYGLNSDTATYNAFGFGLHVNVYNSADLQAVINGINAGSGSSYTTLYLPYITTSKTNRTITFNKGPNPQEANYTGGWATYLTAYQNAVRILAKPDTNQTEINNATETLISAYSGLTGFNTTVNYAVKYINTVTNQELIPSQTGSRAAGYVVTVDPATIDGFTCVNNNTQVKTLSGKNATETVVFNYTPTNYTLTLVTNNDANSITNLTIAYEGAITQAMCNDYGTKEHYTFAGWYYDTAYQNPVNFTNLTMSNANLRFYGKWELTPVHVNYNCGAAGTATPTQYLPGDTATAPSPTPSFAGYLFAGWYEDSAYQTEVTWGFEMGYTDVTVYGKYIDVNGRVAFVTNGGSAIADVTGLVTGSVVNEPGSDIAGAPVASTRDGYSLVGWFYDEGCTQPVTWPITMSSSTGFLLYAKWTPTIQTISFNVGPIINRKFDTPSISPISGETDTPIAAEDIPPAPRKFGYIFSRWALSGAPYSFTTYPTRSITLNAVWTATPYEAIIEVDTYKEEYGAATPIETARPGDTVLVRMTSTTNFFTGSSLFVFMYDKNFYDLQGSDTSAFTVNTANDYISGIDASYSGLTTSTNLNWPSSIIMQSLNYNAIQVAIDPTVTGANYNAEPMADGTWMVEFRLRVKDSVTPGSSGTVYMDNAWTRNADNSMGSMFYGWCPQNTTAVFDSFNNVVTPDLTYATATVRYDETPRPSTTAVVNTNGGAYADSSVTKTFTGEPGQAIAGYTAPTRAGYTLTSWTKSDDNTVTWIEGYYAAVSGTYNAQWEANNYDVTFYTDTTGTTVHSTQTVAYGNNIAAPTEPTRTGYVFSGWVDADNTAITLPAPVPIGGATYYATWIANPNTPFVIKCTYVNPVSGSVASTNNNRTGTTGYAINIVESVPATPAADTLYITYAELPTVLSGNFVFSPTDVRNEMTEVILPDGTTIVELFYEPCPVSVPFKANGGIFSQNNSETYTVDATYGQLATEVVPEVAPTKVGYTFTAWSPAISATSRINRNSNYTAQWSVNRYNATFNSGDGYFNNDTTDHQEVIEVNYNANITAPTAPVRPGYTFQGWSTDGTTVLASLGTMDSVDGKSFTAVWELTVYTLTYKVDGATVATEPYHLNDSVTVAANRTKTGYTFSGWTSADVTITGAGATFAMPANNVTITATFTANPYDAKFYILSTDSTPYETVSTLFDQTVIPPATDPTRAGYEFAGWALSTNPGTAVEDVVMNSTAGLTFYAIWTPSTQTYYVDLYCADTAGAYPSTPTETLDFTASTEDVVSYVAQARTGFTYTATGSTTSGTIPATGNLRLRINYTRNKYNFVTSVDGVNTSTTQVYYGATVSAPSAPTKVGYTFDKWVDSNDAAMNFSTFTMPASAFTVYATWTINTHNAYFYIHEGDAEYYAVVENVNYGAPITAPADPTVTGYSFTRWSPAVGTMADNDMNFYAVLDANSYDAKFYVGTTLHATVPTDYDAQIVLPEPPTKTGYHFDGWTPEVGVMDDVNGKTFTAVFSPNSYNVIFNANGGYFDGDISVTSKTVPTLFDATPVQPATNPTRDGYNFAGWDPAINVLDTVGGETYTAKWVALTDRQYTVSVYIMNTQGNYTGVVPAVTTYRDGTTDAYLTLVAGTHYTVPGAGYALDTALSDVGGTIPGTGVANFNVYIKRNQFVFTTNVDGAKTDTSYYFGAAIATPETPTKTGYTFAAWSPSIPETMPANALEVSATWNAANVAYTINIYEALVDGTYASTPTRVDNGTALTGSSVTADTTAATGFTFDAANSAITATVAADGSTVLTVKYSRNQYVFTSNVDGVKTDTTYYYGAAVATPATPSKTGYTFNSWSPAVPATMPANAYESVAQWDINGYAVTYYDGVNATAIDTENVNYNDDITAHTEPERTGYTFAGWMSDYDNTVYQTADFPISMPASAVNFTAQWTINSYRVVFRSLADVVSDTMVDYNAQINAPAAPIRTGYTFNGWALAGSTSIVRFPQTMGTTALTYMAQWTINKHTIRYYIDAATEPYAAVEYNYNAAITPVAEPERAGYTFSGWSAIPANMPDSDVRVDGTFTAIDYTVSYSYTGTVPAGAPTAPASTIKHINDTVAVEPNAVYAGYTFSGWTTTDATVAGGSFTMPADDVAFTGSWTADTQTYYVEIYRMKTDGTYAATPDSTLEFNALTAAEVSYTMPSETGFTADTANCTLAGTIPATGNLTLVAKYSRNQYTFTTDVDGVLTPTTYYYGEAIATPASPEKAGYTFEGWLDSVPSVMPAEAVTVVAQWAYVDYTVSYRYTNTPDYGTVPALPEQATGKHIGDAVTVAAAPSLAGYTFSGWTTTGATVTAGSFTMPAANVEFVGTWTEIVYDVTYSYTNTPTGAPALPEASTATVGDVITVANVPSLEGYTFNGWNYGGSTVTSITMPADDVAITGTWVVNSYNVTFVSNGETVLGPTPTVYGTAITTPATPVRNGYTFNGWSPEVPEAMPAEPLTFTATWTANTQNYTVSVYKMRADGTYSAAPTETITLSAATDTAVSYEMPAATGFTPDTANSTLTGTIPSVGTLNLIAKYTRNQYSFKAISDNNTIVDTTYYYGATVTPIADGEKEGYTFTEWSPAVPLTMPADDVTVVAQFSINTYAVTFLDYSGNTFDTKQVTYGQAITLPDTNPSQQYYTFEGWDSVPATMPANALTISPIFARVPVELKLVAGSTAIIDTTDATPGVNGYIYGLATRLNTTTLLASYLAVEGDGSLIVTPTKYNLCGTGTKVEVYDNVSEEVVQTYYLVIFGDLNGDSDIDQIDSGVLNGEILGSTDWSDSSSENYKHYLVLAGDISGNDGRITSQDKAAVRDIASYLATVDQTTANVTYSV